MILKKISIETSLFCLKGKYIKSLKEAKKVLSSNSIALGNFSLFGLEFKENEKGNIQLCFDKTSDFDECQECIQNTEKMAKAFIATLRNDTKTLNEMIEKNELSENNHFGQETIYTIMQVKELIKKSNEKIKQSDIITQSLKPVSKKIASDFASSYFDKNAVACQTQYMKKNNHYSPEKTIKELEMILSGEVQKEDLKTIKTLFDDLKESDSRWHCFKPEDYETSFRTAIASTTIPEVKSSLSILFQNLIEDRQKIIQEDLIDTLE